MLFARTNHKDLNPDLWKSAKELKIEPTSQSLMPRTHHRDKDNVGRIRAMALVVKADVKPEGKNIGWGWALERKGDDSLIFL